MRAQRVPAIFGQARSQIGFGHIIVWPFNQNGRSQERRQAFGKPARLMLFRQIGPAGLVLGQGSVVNRVRAGRVAE